MAAINLEMKVDTKKGAAAIEIFLKRMAEAPGANDEYKLIETSKGCGSCGADRRYSVSIGTGDEEVQIGMETDDKELAEMVCTFMNQALHAALERLGAIMMGAAVVIETPSAPRPLGAYPDDITGPQNAEVDIRPLSPAWKRDNDRTSLLLNQVTEGWTVPRSAIPWWSDLECQVAEVWAHEIIRSVNNDIPHPAMPDHVNRYRSPILADGSAS